MDFNTLLSTLREEDIKFSAEYYNEKEILLNNEALFQLPFLSIVVLLLSKNRVKPRVDMLGQIVGECLELSMQGFKGSSQHLGWSANLRIRTVKALNFLELSNLVQIDIKNKRVKSTKLGTKIINDLLKTNGDLSYTLKLISRHYRNINVEKKLELEIYEIK